MPPYRRLASTRILLLCLLLPLANSSFAQSILSLGDSLTSGFPNGDMVDYQASLPGGVTFVGDSSLPNASTSESDSGALFIGGNGNYISRSPKVGGPAVTSVFPAPGVLDKLTLFAPSPDPSPDYVVLLAGVNDLMQLVSPGLPTHSFTPNPATPDDYTASGTFSVDDGSGNPPLEFDVDPLIDRYEALLDAVASRYPGTAEIICLALAPIDEDNHQFAAVSYTHLTLPTTPYV